MTAAGDVVVKLMSATRAEFERSLAHLTPSCPLDRDGTTTVPHAGCDLTLRFEQLPRRRLGGLIAMPQARVTIDLSLLPEVERVAFLARFDLAFQRGGG